MRENIGEMPITHIKLLGRRQWIQTWDIVLCIYLAFDDLFNKTIMPLCHWSLRRVGRVMK